MNGQALLVGAAAAAAFHAYKAYTATTGVQPSPAENSSKKAKATPAAAADPQQPSAQPAGMFSKLFDNASPTIVDPMSRAANVFPSEEAKRKAAIEAEGLPYLPRRTELDKPSK